MEFNKFDKEIFKHIIECDAPNAQSIMHGDKQQSLLRIGQYSYDYRHAIIQYYKQCGCRIRNSDMMLYDMYRINYYAPLKLNDVDIEEFMIRYKKGIWIDTGVRWMYFILFILICIIISFIIGVNW